MYTPLVERFLTNLGRKKVSKNTGFYQKEALKRRKMATNGVVDGVYTTLPKTKKYGIKMPIKRMVDGVYTESRIYV